MRTYDTTNNNLTLESKNKVELETHDKNLEKRKEVKLAIKGKEASTQTETVEEEAANKKWNKDCEKEDLAEKKFSEEELPGETRGKEDQEKKTNAEKEWET